MSQNIDPYFILDQDLNLELSHGPNSWYIIQGQLIQDLVNKTFVNSSANLNYKFSFKDTIMKSSKLISNALNNIASAINNLAININRPQLKPMPQKDVVNKLTSNKTFTSASTSTDYTYQQTINKEMVHISKKEYDALVSIYDAITDKANDPDYHNTMMRQIRSSSPVLYAALDRLIIARKFHFNRNPDIWKNK